MPWKSGDFLGELLLTLEGKEGLERPTDARGRGAENASAHAATITRRAVTLSFMIYFVGQNSTIVKMDA